MAEIIAPLSLSWFYLLPTCLPYSFPIPFPCPSHRHSSSCILATVRWASSSVIGFDLFWQFPSPALRRTLRNRSFTDYLGHELEKFFSRQLGRWCRQSEMLQCRPRHSYPYLCLARGVAVALWLRHYPTNRQVAGSIPDGVIGIFQWHNPSGRTVALGSTQLLTEMSTRCISWW